jgi:hypothetical protein
MANAPWNSVKNIFVEITETPLIPQEGQVWEIEGVKLVIREIDWVKGLARVMVMAPLGQEQGGKHALLVREVWKDEGMWKERADVVSFDTEGVARVEEMWEVMLKGREEWVKQEVKPRGFTYGKTQRVLLGLEKRAKSRVLGEDGIWISDEEIVKGKDEEELLLDLVRIGMRQAILA